MLLVLGCAVLLLFVVPWMLLGLGRLIAMATGGQAGAAAAGSDAAHETGQAAWFRRPMRPAFTRLRRT